MKPDSLSPDLIDQPIEGEGLLSPQSPSSIMSAKSEEAKEGSKSGKRRGFFSLSGSQSFHSEKASSPKSSTSILSPFMKPSSPTSAEGSSSPGKKKLGLGIFTRKSKKDEIEPLVTEQEATDIGSQAQDVISTVAEGLIINQDDSTLQAKLEKEVSELVDTVAAAVLGDNIDTADVESKEVIGSTTQSENQNTSESATEDKKGYRSSSPENTPNDGKTAGLLRRISRFITGIIMWILSLFRKSSSDNSEIHVKAPPVVQESKPSIKAGAELKDVITLSNQKPNKQKRTLVI